MTIGLEQFRDERVADRLHCMLALPFVGRVGDYPVNRVAGGDSPSGGGGPRTALGAGGRERVEV
jgi:hypothetical protein